MMRITFDLFRQKVARVPVKMYIHKFEWADQANHIHDTLHNLLTNMAHVLRILV